MKVDYRLPSATRPFVHGAVLSGFMSLIVSGVATWKSLGVAAGFVSLWLAAWGLAWPIAFVVLLFVSPIVRRLVDGIVAPAPLSPAVETRQYRGTRDP